MMNRSRTLLAGLGATAALAWAPTAIGQVMVTAPAQPLAPTQVIVVEPAETAMKVRPRNVRRTETSREVRTPDGRVAMTSDERVASDAPRRGFFGRRQARVTEAPRTGAGHIQAHVAAIEPAPAGSATAPAMTALNLDDGSRVLVPRTTAPTVRVGDRVNVDYAAGGTGERYATKFMIASETEAP